MLIGLPHEVIWSVIVFGVHSRLFSSAGRFIKIVHVFAKREKSGESGNSKDDFYSITVHALRLTGDDGVTWDSAVRLRGEDALGIRVSSKAASAVTGTVTFNNGSNFMAC